MKEIEIFDPAMCCSTGVCGPSVDKNLLRIATLIDALKNMGIEVKRHNLSSEPQAFIHNEKVKLLLQKKGADVLPVTLVDGEIAELEFGVDTEQALAALDERRIQRERYIGSLQQLDNIVLFALVFQLDLILEIKGCLGVPVDVGVEQVADLGVESQLDVFVKVGLDVAPSCFIDRRVVGEVADYLQCKVGTSAGCNLYLRLVHQAFQLATDLVESGYLAQQAAFAAVSAVLLLLLCPEVVHQVLHLVVLILLKCHKLAADNDAANLGYLDIAVSVGVVLDGGRHIGRVVQIQRALRRRAVGGDGEMQRRPSAVLFLLCLQRNGRHEQQQ